MSISTIFAIVFIILFVIVIALTCGRDEEEKEEKKGDENTMQLSYEELEARLKYAYDQWVKCSDDTVHYTAKICCLYYAIDCKEPFTFDKLLSDFLKAGGEISEETKEQLREVLLEIVSDGYLDYDGKKHTYYPTFYQKPLDK